MIGKISIFHIKFHCKHIKCILTYTKIENISIYLRYSIFRNYEESYYIFKKSNDSQPRKCIFTQNSSKIFKKSGVHSRACHDVNFQYISTKLKIYIVNKRIFYDFFTELKNISSNSSYTISKNGPR